MNSNSNFIYYGLFDSIVLNFSHSIILLLTHTLTHTHFKYKLCCFQRISEKVDSYLCLCLCTFSVRSIYEIAYDFTQFFFSTLYIEVSQMTTTFTTTCLIICQTHTSDFDFVYLDCVSVLFECDEVVDLIYLW